MIHPGLIPPPLLRGTATNRSPPNCPPTPTGTWAVWGTGRAREKPTRSTGLPSRSLLGKRPGAAPSIYAPKPCLRQWGRSRLPLSRVLSCWGPAHWASSLQRARVPLPPWLRPAPPAPQAVRLPSVPGVGSRLRGFAGGPGKGSRPTCRPPPPPENGGDPSDGPAVPRRQVCPRRGGGGHRSFVLLLWHTHGFSVLFSGKTVLCQGARCRGPGAGGGWERVLCWDEALYPHIFLWEREPGSSVALPPSVASSAQGPSAFCLPFPSP